MPTCARSEQHSVLAEMLQRTIAELPESCAQAVSLHHIGGLSCADIARIQEVSSASVYLRIWRGLRTVRVIFANRR